MCVENEYSRTEVLKVWSLDQQHQNHLENWQKCGLSGLILDLLILA